MVGLSNRIHVRCVVSTCAKDKANQPKQCWPFYWFTSMR